MNDETALLEKVWSGARIDRHEALRLYRLPLEELGALADRRRQLAQAKAHDGRGNDIVTYIVDRNVNYTNVCNVYCKFCAFYRTEKDTDSYVIVFGKNERPHHLSALLIECASPLNGHTRRKARKTP